MITLSVHWTKLRRLERSQVVARPLEEIFEFFGDPRSLEQLTPAFLHFHFLNKPPLRMEAGTVLHYRVRLYGVPVRWIRVSTSSSRRGA